MSRLPRLLGALGAIVLIGVLPAAPAHAAAPPTLPDDDQIFQTIKEITAKGYRRAGTAAGQYAVDYVRDHFRAYGLSDVHVEETPTYSWEATEHALDVAGTPIDAFPVAYSQSPSATAVGESATPDGGLRAPLVDGGLGTLAELATKDVKGKIVVFDLKFLLPVAGLLPLTEFLWDPAQTLTTDVKGLLTANPYITTYETAIRAIQDSGAAGFIGVLSDYFDSDKYYNEFYRRLSLKIPGMWVTKTEGAHIRALMAERRGAQARMVLRTRRAKVASHVVIGYLDGRSKDTIMVTSHHDSVWDGAVEDGSGTAEVLALAKHYGAQRAGSREKSLMFATFDSHYSGYQAHQAFVKRHITERTDPHRPVADVTIEHIAKHGSVGDDGKLVISELPEPRGIFENLQPALKLKLIEGVVRNDLRRTSVLNGTALQPAGIPTDASFALLAGLPTVSYISGPIYLYDQADTLDKVAKSELQKVALTFLELIDEIDTTPSGQIGMPPLMAGKPAADTPWSTDAADPSTAASAAPCRPATRGAAVRDVRLRLLGRRVILSFRARRTATLRLTVAHRGRRAVRLPRTRRISACRRYRIALPRTVVRVRLSAAGRSVSAVRRTRARP